MKQAAYILFETLLGVCGIAWEKSDPNGGQSAVTSFQLPEVTKRLTEKRVAALTGGRRVTAPPPYIGAIIKKVQKHLRGDAQDFRDIPVDLDGTSLFAKQVYAVARTIPSGRTMTYGDLARTAGRPGASRAVGQVMGRNPIPLIIPCHRVVAAGNRPGGFSAHGGVATKARMLEIEGATLGPPPVITSINDLKRAAKLLKKKDPRLGRILSRPIEFRLRPEHSPYATLVEAVVHQQLSPKAAETILNRVMELYPGRDIPAPADLLKTPDDRLRSAGLSRSKARALKDIAARTIDGTVPSQKAITLLRNDEIIERLTSIYGVGQWTVEMMLIFNLGRMDVLPVDDYALRKSIAEVFRMKYVPTPKQVRTLGETWRPHRTVASLYLWNFLKT